MVERLKCTKSELQELLTKSSAMTAAENAVSAAEFDVAGAFGKLGSHSKSNSHNAAANTESFVISTSKLNGRCQFVRPDCIGSASPAAAKTTRAAF